jgi:hypothetical protein
LSLGVKLRRLGDELELGFQRREEFMAEVRDLFLISLVRLADLSNRTVRDR